MDGEPDVRRPIEHYLQIDDETLDRRWTSLQEWLQQRFGKPAGIESILFLIGVQSSGSGYQPKLKKEVKQDLIMEGTYQVFEAIDLYRKVPAEDAQAYSWERSGPALTGLSVEDQEKLLRVAILEYFDHKVDFGS